ncbi:hypothetical protein Tco_0256198 [Tanacetum coccineum]|uniref:Uncharacterized protein n=1 Tax=Tanacetum coccineum TaxID=301880 RepID=A0ABQ4ZFS4_9ASTR
MISSHIAMLRKKGLGACRVRSQSRRRYVYGKLIDVRLPTIRYPPGKQMSLLIFEQGRRESPLEFRALVVILAWIFPNSLDAQAEAMADPISQVRWKLQERSWFNMERKDNSRRNIHTSSPITTRRQVLHLLALRTKAR